MANTVTKEAKPLRCEQKTHHKTDRSAGVTSNYKNGLVNRFTVSVSPLWRSGRGGEGRRGEGGRRNGGREDGEGIKIGEKMGGRENLRARSSRRSEKGLGRHGVEGGGKVAGGGEACRLSIPLLFATDVLHNN